jgi:hypothetical protein
MRRIFKYPVEIADVFAFSSFVGARPLAVQMQRGNPFVWMMVDDERQKTEHQFKIIGTGHPIDMPMIWWKYVGTFQTDGGDLVWHLFWHDDESMEAAT